MQVLADAAHQKAKFDRTDPKVSGKGRRSTKGAFNEALAEPPGSPPPGDPSATEPAADDEREYDADRREDY